MPRGKRTLPQKDQNDEQQDQQDEPTTKRSETLKKQLNQSLIRWRFYTKQEILDLIKKIDNNSQVSNEIPSLYSVKFSDDTSLYLTFSEIKNRETHICTPQHVSVKLEKAVGFNKSDRILIFIAANQKLNLQWTTENHHRFPKNFKDAIFTFLLCQTRTRSKLPSDINKIIFSYLNIGDFRNEKSYMFFGEGKKSSLSISEQCGFDLPYLISSENVRLLHTKLERCFKNKYGAWLCFISSGTKTKSKFAGYD